MNRNEEMYGKADIHIHTSLTDGLAEVKQILDHVQWRTGLDVIAITDHDDITAACQAREIVRRGNYRFDVVVGMEVTTLDGHLLALYIEKPVPTYRSLVKTIEAVHAQGGLCVVPHPMNWLTRSVGQSMLDRIVQGKYDGIYLDGMETMNSSPGGQVARWRARELNRIYYHLAETGGSDAHFLHQVGAGYTLFPGRRADDLFNGIIDRKTQPGRSSVKNGRGASYGEIVYQLVKGLVIHPGNMAGRSLLRLLKAYAYEYCPRFSL